MSCGAPQWKALAVWREVVQRTGLNTFWHDDSAEVFNWSTVLIAAVVAVIWHILQLTIVG